VSWLEFRRVLFRSTVSSSTNCVTLNMHLPIMVSNGEQFYELCYIEYAPSNHGVKRWAVLRTVLHWICTFQSWCQTVSSSTRCVTLTAHRPTMVSNGEQFYKLCYIDCAPWQPGVKWWAVPRTVLWGLHSMISVKRWAVPRTVLHWLRTVTTASISTHPVIQTDLKCLHLCLSV
jgi:hypothetical protein